MFPGRSPSARRRGASAARSTRRACASCFACSSGASAEWSTFAAKRGAKAAASGAPIGARSIDRRRAPKKTTRSEPTHRCHPEDEMLNADTLPEFQKALAELGVDGWLLFDFRGLNPIAKEL